MDGYVTTPSRWACGFGSAFGALFFWTVPAHASSAMGLKGLAELAALVIGIAAHGDRVLHRRDPVSPLFSIATCLLVVTGIVVALADA